MSENRIRKLEPCRCNTGCYCRRHGRYTSRNEPPARLNAVLYGLEHDSSGHQRCGGGIRIIRKQGRSD